MNLQKHINGKSQQIILAYSSMATATPYVSGLKKPLNLTFCIEIYWTKYIKDD